MNGRNRHKKYRKSVYKRHGAWTVIISVSATLAVVLVTLLIVGSVLHAQSEERNRDTDTNPDTQGAIQEQKQTLTDISAHSALLGDSLNTRLEELKDLEIGEVSILLNKKDGSLLYASSAAQGLGISTSSNSLTAACEKAEELGIYVSGIYYLNAFSIEDKLLRSVELSRSAAIVAEALSAGVDDVVIIAPDMMAEHTEEFIRFTDEIHFLSEVGYVGIAIPDAIFEDESASSIINKLDKSIDFLAVNAVEYGETAPSEYVDGCINSPSSFYIRMYNMRLLLPHSAESDAQNEIIASAENNGIKNWQIVQNG